MHGRLKVKTSKEQEEEQRLKKRDTALHFRDLSQRLFKLRPKLTFIDNYEEFFKITTELLLLNADFYTVWNIRREALLAYVDKIQRDIQQEENPNDNNLFEEQVMKVWKDELSFTNDCLRKNEKSYSVWQHRIWILSKMPKSQYELEILLCNSFLTKDERNFHCWDYRSYISDVLAQRDIEKEFEFTTEKIRSNFSNFSAWHRRHKLLLRAMAMPEDKCPKTCNLKLIWTEEYNMILNALFTDPTDQSPWLYHDWLVKNNFGNYSHEHMKKLLTLEELEPDNKWIKRALESCKHYMITVN